MPPPRFDRQVNLGKIRAHETLRQAENSGIVETVQVISGSFGLPFTGVTALLHRESNMGLNQKQGKKLSSAAGVCQITDGTMIEWVAAYGKKCVDILEKTDPRAAAEMRLVANFVELREGKSFLDLKKYNAFCRGNKKDLKRRILDLRSSPAASIALTCAHLSEDKDELIRLFRARQKHLLDSDHLVLLGIGGGVSDEKISPGSYSFLLWMKHLWGSAVFYKMLNTEAEKPMAKILNPQKPFKAGKILVKNGFPANANVRQVFQLMAAWYETVRLGHEAYFAGELSPAVERKGEYKETGSIYSGFRSSKTATVSHKKNNGGKNNGNNKNKPAVVKTAADKTHKPLRPVKPAQPKTPHLKLAKR